MRGFVALAAIVLLAAGCNRGKSESDEMLDLIDALSVPTLDMYLLNSPFVASGTGSGFGGEWLITDGDKWFSFESESGRSQVIRFDEDGALKNTDFQGTAETHANEMTWRVWDSSLYIAGFDVETELVLTEVERTDEGILFRIHEDQEFSPEEGFEISLSIDAEEKGTYLYWKRGE